MITLKDFKNWLTGHKHTTQPTPEPTPVTEPEAPKALDSFDYYFMELSRKMAQNEPFTTQDFAQAQLIMACMGRKAQEAQRKKTKSK